MSRILLADDSPHAQRMGERILREEGYEVVTVTDGKTALVRLADVDPDVVFADISLPSHSGYEICKMIKTTPRHQHVRVILTAGLLEPFDDDQAKDAGCDGVLKKPFESSVVLDTVKPLIAAAVKDRQHTKAEPVTRTDTVAAAEAIAPPKPQPAEPATPEPQKPGDPKPDTPKPEPPRIDAVRSIAMTPAPAAPPATIPVERPTADIAARIEQVFESLPRAVPVRILSDPVPPPGASNGAAEPVDAERVRAAVTVALDAALPNIIDKITEQVLIALGQ
jgi:CheY-like chemotaxis protein